ncbi:MAG: 2-phospho-L-lactate transferase CofD family protein [Mobilicoccus sp.]|nr:2-phospho-L-lactate transferase CofD family protein [Mobilicoccus sp.]
MQLTILACGDGARELVAVTRHFSPTVIAGTAEDITLCGLRVCPDLDALTDVLTFAARSTRQTHRVESALREVDAAPEWYRLDDVTIARAIARSQWLGLGIGLSEITARLAGDLGGARLLPMCDQPVEAHVVVEPVAPVADGLTMEDEETPPLRAVHVREWLAGGQGRVVRTTAAGLNAARPSPEVLEAIRSADLVVVPLTAPLTGIGVMLSLPGMRDTLRGTSAPVVGISPALLDRRGEEDALLAPLDLRCTSADVGGLFVDVLDGYLVPHDDLDACRGGYWRDVVVVATAEDADLLGPVLDVAERLGVTP